MKRARTIFLVLLALLAFGWITYRAPDVIQARTGRSVSVRQMHDLSVAASAYVSSHGNLFPPTLTALFAASPGLPPGTAISPLSPDQTKPSYEIVVPSPSIMQISDTSTTPMIRSLFTLKDGSRIVAFCDGHVEFVSDK